MGVILGAFFLSTLWLVFGIPTIFNSPDENANYYFTSVVALKDAPTEILNDDLGGLLHPRSVVAIGTSLAPRSFLGLPIIFGFIGRLFNLFNSIDGVLVLTPILAILALLAWRSTIFKLFHDSIIADLSALFLMLHPAFWYYSARTMMHNVGFVAFLIFALWFLLVCPWQQWSKGLLKSRYVDFALAGICIGLALAFRTSEVIWVFASFSILAFIAIRRKWVSLGQALIAVVSIVVLLAPFAVANKSIYGDYFTTGYTVDTSVASAVGAYEGDGLAATPLLESEVIETRISLFDEPMPGVFAYLFPFGIHELAIVRHIWQYCFWLYPWMSVFAIVGLVLALTQVQGQKLKAKSQQLRAFAIYTLVLSTWLAVVYGSWSFYDNPDPSAITIGNSYVRYWLPVFVLSTPFMAVGVKWLSERFKPKKVQNVILVAVVLLCAGFSGYRVFQGDDGLIATREHLLEFYEKKVIVLQATEDDAIIIVDRADKFLWPDRRVVVPLRSEATYSALPKMLENVAVYYFGITLPEADLNYLNLDKLGKAELRIDLVLTVGDESLYRILKIE